MAFKNQAAITRDARCSPFPEPRASARAAPRFAAICTFVLCLTPSATAVNVCLGDPPPQEPKIEAPSLSDLVHDYFQTPDAADRRKLVETIDKAADGDISSVVDALAKINIWSPLTDRRGVFSFTSGDGKPVQVSYELPPGYDPTKRHQTILCTTGDDKAPHADLARARRFLGSSSASFVMLSPHRAVDSSFWLPPARAGGLRRLVRAARRVIHLDTNRLFLFGRGHGGDAAWSAALAHPDLLAGIITESAYPRLPYPRHTTPLLLENLREVPVLMIRSQPMTGITNPRAKSIASHDRTILNYARQAGLPIESVKQASNEETQNAAIADLLAHRRSTIRSSVAHWFRYLGQGNTDWLRQTRFLGDVWDADQLSILPAPTTDADAFIIDTLKSKLGYVIGSIEGQTITLETRRCAAVELRLSPDQLDFNQPITLLCNGRKRNTRDLRPSISTLLEEAYSDWDFQRPVVATLTFTIKGP